MQSLALRQHGDNQPSLVIRRHDMGGTDYELVTAIGRGMADMLASHGIVGWRCTGSRRMGITISKKDDNVASLVIRCAGHAEVHAEIPMNDALACVSPSQEAQLSWIIPPQSIN